jgi:hypothetical protein
MDTPMPSKTHRLLNWPLLLVLTLFAIVPTKVFASCSDQGGPRASLDKSWVKINRRIYLGREGKIFETRFNSNQLTVLADHGFNYLSTFTLSPDVQYIAYKGYKDKHFSSYLYDIKHGRDYKLPINYESATSISQGKYFSLDPQVEFSPDSKKLAWPAVDPQRNSQQIVIMNLENQTSQVRSYPLDVRTLGEYRTTIAKWSPDGKYLYFDSIAFPVGAYYKYDVVAEQFARIDGHDGRFIENGRELPYYARPCHRWSCAEQDKPMAGESATIDNDYRLIIKTADGKEVTVDQGALTPCGTPTMWPIAWLENGKYYVYDLDGIAYIYGIKEHRKAVLFDMSGTGVFYGWANTENGKASPF